MKSIRLIILFAVLSFISGNLPVGLSAFKLQKYTTSCSWSGRGAIGAPYRVECAQPVKSWLPIVFQADQKLAMLQHTAMAEVRLNHQQDQFKRIKPVILPVKLFIPALNYTCNSFLA